MNVDKACHARGILFVDVGSGGIGVEVGEGARREEDLVEGGVCAEGRADGDAFCRRIAKAGEGGVMEVVGVAGIGESAEAGDCEKEFGYAGVQI